MTESMQTIDHLPPQSIDAEEAVLGCHLMDKDARYRQGDISGVDFYRDANRSTYEAMERIWRRGEPLDYLTLVAELRDCGDYEAIGGMTFLSRLCGCVPTALHVETYAARVHNTATLRRLIQGCGTIAALAYDETQPLEGVLTKATEIISRIAIGASVDDVWTAERQITELSDYMDAVMAGQPSGIMTRLDVHSVLRGYRKGSLYVVGAVSGAGKTAWMQSEARSLRRAGRTVHFASSEMSRLELNKRAMAAELGRGWDQIERELEPGTRLPETVRKVAAALQTLDRVTPTVYHAGAMTVDNIRRRVARQQAQGGCDVVFVDYLQRLRPGGKKAQGRYQDVDEIAMDLKNLAADLAVPVVVAAQFNLVKVEMRPLVVERNGATVDGRMPEDSDFRESGGIYQEADVALGLYRRSRWDSSCEQSEAYLLVMKNRHGAADQRFRMCWRGETTEFVNPTRGPDIEPAGGE